MALAATTQGPRIAAGHGQHIFIYCHVRTKQVIYSLDRVMNNHHSLKQIPFLGKKSKPPVLRKDFWRPLATVTFPSGHQGREAFRELREFRKRHEHEWSMEELGVQTRKEAWQKVMDQKANTVADLAAVLFRQEKLAAKQARSHDDQAKYIEEFTRKQRRRVDDIQGQMKSLKPAAIKGEEQALVQYKTLRAEKMRIRRHLEKPIPHYAAAGRYHALNDPHPKQKRTSKTNRRQVLPRMSMEGLRIRWSNIGDAEFAKTWPDPVVHEEIGSSDNSTRHTHSPLSAPESVLPPVQESKVVGDDAQPVAESETRPTERAPVTTATTTADEPNWISRVVDRLDNGRT